MIDTIQYERKLTSNGYAKIFTDEGWKLEHHFVLEDYIGRKLKKEERIHHIDGIKTNNDINNLVIFPDNKSHTHFHKQIKQHGYTQPRRTQIRILKEYLRNERINNIKNLKC